MKTRKSNSLLLIIAINLTLLTLIQLDIFPSRVHANNDFNTINANYGLIPLNENGRIEVELSPNQLEAIKSSMNDEYIIERILFCLDGSTIEDGTLSTYCDR